jgi:uncharacterized protein
MKQRKTVLITGASKGIGAEFARIFSAKGYDLVLVARSKDLLSKLKSKTKTINNSVLAVALDLSKPEAPKQLFDALAKQKIKIDVLVNNAGFGDWGAFSTSDLQKQKELIMVNVSALTELTHLFIAQADKDKQTYILNVGSVAGFVPGPYMSVYFATKAYVLSFSEALSAELMNSQISVTCLCPGPTRTEFAKTANDQSGTFDGKIPSAYDVAIFGYNAMMQKEVIAIHGTQNKIVANLPRFLPRSVVRNKVAQRHLGKASLEKK